MRGDYSRNTAISKMVGHGEMVRVAPATRTPMSTVGHARLMRRFSRTGRRRSVLAPAGGTEHCNRDQANRQLKGVFELRRFTLADQVKTRSRRSVARRFESPFRPNHQIAVKEPRSLQAGVPGVRTSVRSSRAIAIFHSGVSRSGCGPNLGRARRQPAAPESCRRMPATTRTTTDSGCGHRGTSQPPSQRQQLREKTSFGDRQGQLRAVRVRGDRRGTARRRRR